MSKHTPGPWIVKTGGSWDRGETREVWTENGWPIAVSDLGNNADLIAAAPDLLSTLKDLVRANEVWNIAVQQTLGAIPNWTDSYLDAARAAIQKATPVP